MAGTPTRTGKPKAGSIPVIFEQPLITHEEWAGLVRMQRAKLGISQDALSYHLGVSIGALRHWEQGQRVPALWQLVARELNRMLAEQQRCGARIYDRARAADDDGLSAEELDESATEGLDESA